MATIAIDLDDTLNCLVEVWLERYSAICADNLTPEDIMDWDIATYADRCSREVLFGILDRPNFFATLPIRPGAYVAVKFLNTHHNVVIVTSYVNPCHLLGKALWVGTHLPFLSSKQIAYCQDKSLIKADYLIDDGAHNVEAFPGLGIVFDQPWKRHLVGFPRMKGWDLVCQMARSS